MTNSTEEPNYKNKNAWVRGLTMLLFAFAFGMAETLIGLVAIGQFLFLLFTGSPNAGLAELGVSLRKFVGQVIDYLTMSSDERPFPFSPWPDDREREPLAELQVSEAESPSGQVI